MNDKIKIDTINSLFYNSNNNKYKEGMLDLLNIINRLGGLSQTMAILIKENLEETK